MLYLHKYLMLPLSPYVSALLNGMYLYVYLINVLIKGHRMILFACLMVWIICISSCMDQCFRHLLSYNYYGLLSV